MTIRRVVATLEQLREVGLRYRNALMIKQDLDFVVRATTELLTLPPRPSGQSDHLTDEDVRIGTYRKALWIAACISYVRCFKTNRHRRGLSQHSVRTHSTNVDGIHDFIMKVRNEHFAHSESEELERVFLHMGIAEDRSGTLRFDGVTALAVTLSAGTEEQAQHFHALAVALLEGHAKLTSDLYRELSATAAELPQSELARAAAASEPVV